MSSDPIHDNFDSEEEDGDFEADGTTKPQEDGVPATNALDGVDGDEEEDEEEEEDDEEDEEDDEDVVCVPHPRAVSRSPFSANRDHVAATEAPSQTEPFLR
jgi:hypothetical protein